MSKRREKEEDRHVHADCGPCSGGEDAYHDGCTERCGGFKLSNIHAVDDCGEGCPCTCNTPLSRDERMAIRRVIGRFP